MTDLAPALAQTRPHATLGWELWRCVVGVGYLAAAVFNTVYTFQRREELDGYADGAWFGFLADFMRDVFMPNGAVFMALVIAFEVTVGGLVLASGFWVDLGVVATVFWVLLVLPFLAWPYLLTNLVLALVQGVLLFRRFDESVWGLVVARLRFPRLRES